MMESTGLMFKVIPNVSFLIYLNFVQTNLMTNHRPKDLTKGSNFIDYLNIRNVKSQAMLKRYQLRQGKMKKHY